MARALTEGELVALAQDGDGDAYASLVRAHQDIAFRTAMLITQNAAEAEEAAQDALRQGVARAARASGAGEPLRPWLLTIVANEARNRRRSAGRRTALALRVGRSRRGRGRSAEAQVLAAESRARAARRACRGCATTTGSCSAAATCSSSPRPRPRPRSASGRAP